MRFKKGKRVFKNELEKRIMEKEKQIIEMEKILETMKKELEELEELNSVTKAIRNII